MLMLKNATKPHITKRNVFGDLKLSKQQSFETKIKREVWQNLVNHIECGDYTQAELAQILQIYQSDVSNLLRGKFSRFSTDKLIRYAHTLNLQMRFQISSASVTRKENELGSL
jgi:predicted XRE-type DNA-binding protein